MRWLRGSRADVDDVLSRGSLRALEHLRRHPQGVENFRAWIFRILHNLCIDTLKAADRRATALLAMDAPGDPIAAPRCPGLAPDRAVYARELHVALDGAIAALPPRLHAAFRMRFLDEMAYDEISRELAISCESARKRIQQARDLLRQRLAAVA